MLKAILSKKLMVPEIHDLLTKISRMSITSKFQHVRNQCRQCTRMYLLDYAHTGKINSHLQFFFGTTQVRARVWEGVSTGDVKFGYISLSSSHFRRKWECIVLAFC